MSLCVRGAGFADAFEPAALGRLRRNKSEYDPEGVFRANYPVER